MTEETLVSIGDPPPLPPTCSNDSHSWLARGPFKISDSGELCSEFGIASVRRFVSSVKTVERNCRATVWRWWSAYFSFMHSDNVPAEYNPNSEFLGKNIKN